MKQEKVALKTLAIKARVYNRVRTFLFKQQLEKIPDQTKIDFFNELFLLNHDAHWELVAYKEKRQKKAEIQKLREVRKKVA